MIKFLFITVICSIFGAIIGILLRGRFKRRLNKYED